MGSGEPEFRKPRDLKRDETAHTLPYTNIHTRNFIFQKVLQILKIIITNYYYCDSGVNSWVTANRFLKGIV